VSPYGRVKVTPERRVTLTIVSSTCALCIRLTTHASDGVSTLEYMNAVLVARSVDDRADIGRALGMMIERHDVSHRQALAALVRCSDRVQVDLAEVARIFIDLG